jgi:urease accessory protein
VTPLLGLLHLCDSLFPIGGFGYSDGLEAAAAAGQLTSADDLEAWLNVTLDETVRRTDGPALARSWTAWLAEDWRAIVEIDADAIAIRPASATRLSNRAMGLRLLKSWHALYPDARLAQGLALATGRHMAPSLPVAFAGACATSGVCRRDTVEAFAYTRLAAAASAAMRLAAIGQSDAHARLAAVLARVPSAVSDAISPDAVIESFAPALDIAAMSHRYVESRLFRS